MQRNHYVIRGGRDGRERLRMLARVMQPGTNELFARVGVQPGWSCLDIGSGGGDVTMELATCVGQSGHVLGIDSDQTVVAIAQGEAAARQLTNVTFAHCAAESLEVDNAFDLIYCRFLLTHLPDPADVVEKMMRALKPGGCLVVEDIDFTGHFCYPASAAFRRYIDLYDCIVRQRGGDPKIGPRLPSLLLDVNYTDVNVHIEQPTALQGETKLIAPLTWECIAEELIGANLATPSEIQTVAQELYAFARDPHTLMSLPRIVQTWGYRAV